MHKKLYFALSLTVFCYWTESSPVNLGSLEYDKLDTDISDLKYEAEDQELDDLSKVLDYADQTEKSDSKAKTNVKASGFKKKNAVNLGLNKKHNVQDLRKFFKDAGLHEEGTIDDGEIYGVAKGIAEKVNGAKNKEDRKYRKGTKTRGFHRVQHKDEYQKDKLFYEDDETKGQVSKIDGKISGYKIGGGLGFDKGHFHHDLEKGIFGKQGYLDKGFDDEQLKGFLDTKGFDASFKSDS